jgi:hypothetical protein
MSSMKQMLPQRSDLPERGSLDPTRAATLIGRRL